MKYKIVFLVFPEFDAQMNQKQQTTRLVRDCDLQSNASFTHKIGDRSLICDH